MADGKYILTKVKSHRRAIPKQKTKVKSYTRNIWKKSK